MPQMHNKENVHLAKVLRKNMTKEERHIWFDFLKLYPVKFLRQKVIGDYIVDFYCPKAKLVVELDGNQHYEDKGLEKDKIRDEILKGYGLSVIRIPNNEVFKNFYGVCEYIDTAVQRAVNEKQASL